MQGRVAAHLLEAESDDGVIYWNRMDAWIPRPSDAPAGGGRGGRGGGGGGAGGGGRGGGRGGEPPTPPVVPIFKLMMPTELALRMAR
jgi:hypothetical protein